ncbi:gas vesicle protein GvpJ [Halogeometricum salsisoli]|uniref:gas vesicle protein GvpJ n=1 Tax=Halogeometricum salsisoli TaxID=2950536 RepID=UPI003CCDC7E7
MPDPVRPGRDSDSLADVVELLLDKGVVLNADIVVSVGETELLGIRLRAALASFETASEFGLEFPSGTDMEAVEAASQRRRQAKMSPSGRPGLEEERRDEAEEDREDRSVDVMNATVGESDDERSADESGGAGGGDPEAEAEAEAENEVESENASGGEAESGDGGEDTGEAEDADDADDEGDDE